MKQNNTAGSPAFFQGPKTFRQMADEISDGHFAAGDECSIAGEETDRNKHSENYFDYSCQTEQRSERNRLPANQPKSFCPP